MKEPEKPAVPLEAVVYAQVSAWITIVGMVIAILGLIVAFLYGGGIMNETGLLADLFQGRTEGFIWRRDSVFSGMPEQYWFFRQRLDGDELSMIGITISCYGGIVGVWSMFLSMFRKKDTLLYKGGLYTILTLVLGAILTLAAANLIAFR